MTTPDTRPDGWISDLLFKLRVLRYLVSEQFAYWRREVWRKDLDGQYCCDGRECGCCGDTVRQMWSWHVAPPKGGSNE